VSAEGQGQGQACMPAKGRPLRAQANEN